MISSVDLVHYGVSHAKDWVFVDCGTIFYDEKTVKKSLFFFFTIKDRIFAYHTLEIFNVSLTNDVISLE